MHKINNMKNTTKDWLWIGILHSALIGVLCFSIQAVHPYIFVYSLMLGWGIILENHKKAKVFVIAPGSKHTVGRCWETILHPWCQNTSALSLPWPWSWTSARQSLPTQQAVWWLGVLGTEIMRWMLWLHLTTGTFYKACGSGAVDLGAHCMMARYEMLKKARWEQTDSLWITTSGLLLTKTPNSTWVRLYYQSGNRFKSLIRISSHL